MTVLVRAGCHLCDDAMPVLSEICAATGAALVRTDVDDDPELRAEYADRLPVFLVDGREHGFWVVEPARLRAALVR
ncbi:MAG: glutaredoxin family protein [Geodermatophilaceae bacterium]|nr:glutaredoxin family protein [Geodermatophilaceae bacterium]